jgi:hypothetical protein
MIDLLTGLDLALGDKESKRLTDILCPRDWLGRSKVPIQRTSCCTRKFRPRETTTRCSSPRGGDCGPIAEPNLLQPIRRRGDRHRAGHPRHQGKLRLTCPPSLETDPSARAQRRRAYRRTPELKPARSKSLRHRHYIAHKPARFRASLVRCRGPRSETQICPWAA